MQKHKSTRTDTDTGGKPITMFCIIPYRAGIMANPLYGNKPVFMVLWSNSLVSGMLCLM